MKRNIGIHAYGEGSLGQQNYARNLGASTYQVFLGSPQRYWARKENPEDVAIFKGCVQGLNETVICHAPYLINLADDVNSRNWKMSLKSIQSISRACLERDITRIVIHAGSDKGRGIEKAIDSWHQAIIILRQEHPVLMYSIENSAFKSNVFSDIGQLYSMVSTVGVKMCLDTAHYWSAGHGFSKEEYERLLSLRDWIGVIHLNNSPVAMGSSRDRHTNTRLLSGMIPREAFARIVKDFTCPMIMELDNDPDLVKGSLQDLEALCSQ